MKQPIRIALLFVGVFILSATLALYQNYRSSHMAVTITLPSNISKGTIYKDRGGEGPYNYDKNMPLSQLKQKSTITLTPGVYDIVLDDPDNQYEQLVTKKTVTRSTKNVTISSNYTDEQLKKILASQKSDIVASLNEAYPLLAQNYFSGDEQLFLDGKWYGAVLLPFDKNLDTLRVIMKDSNEGWKVAAEPAISIGQPAHKSIPLSVLRAVDLLGNE